MKITPDSYIRAYDLKVVDIKSGKEITAYSVDTEKQTCEVACLDANGKVIISENKIVTKEYLGKVRVEVR